MGLNINLLYFIKFAIKKNNGQTLLEATIALAVLLVILTAIFIVVSSSMNNASFAKDQTLANKYAQEGIESLRNKQLNNYSWFDSLLDDSLNPASTACVGNACTYCVGDDFNFIDSACNAANIGGANPFLLREIILEDESVDCPCSNNDICKQDGGGINLNGTKVTITVRWASGKCPESTVDNPTAGFCHSSQMTTCLYNDNYNL